MGRFGQVRGPGEFAKLIGGVKGACVGVGGVV